MFNYPATELFKAEDRRVVWSIEEYEAALAEGWSEDKPLPVETANLAAPAGDPSPKKKK